MSQIYSQNPGSTEIQSPLIAGITEALAKISSILNLETKTIQDIQLTPISIDNTEDNKNRIYEVSEGNRLWLNSPTPVIKKNGAIITQNEAQFTIDYVGGSITFPNDKKPNESDKITVSATCVVATSKAIDAINSLLNSVKENSDKYKGNYDSVSSLQLEHSSASNGDFAIVFDPLAVYAWKNDGWYDTRSIEDLSNYYQKQEVNDLLDKKEPVIKENGSSTTDDNYYYGGRKTWQDLFAKVRSVALTGLSTASDAVVNASDTILSAIGKLQSQVSKATEKAYLSGTGEPTTSTKGVVGQRYVNTSNGDVYTCTASDGSTYTWAREIKSVNGKSAELGGTVTLSPSDLGAATSSQGDKADTAMQPSVYDTHNRQTDVYDSMIHIYKATFLFGSWDGYGPFSQTAELESVDGGPTVTSSSTLLACVGIDSTLPEDTKNAMISYAEYIAKAEKKLGEGTISVTIDKSPDIDVELYFLIKKSETTDTHSLDPVASVSIIDYDPSEVITSSYFSPSDFSGQIFKIGNVVTVNARATISSGKMFPTFTDEIFKIRQDLASKKPVFISALGRNTGIGNKIPARVSTSSTGIFAAEFVSDGQFNEVIFNISYTI